MPSFNQVFFSVKNCFTSFQNNNVYCYLIYLFIPKSTRNPEKRKIYKKHSANWSKPISEKKTFIFFIIYKLTINFSQIFLLSAHKCKQIIWIEFLNFPTHFQVLIFASKQHHRCTNYTNKRISKHRKY